jgi:hypothetical protein
VQPGPALTEATSIVHDAAREAGRDPASIGMEGRMNIGGADLESAAERAAAWREAGATHLSLNTMGAGLATVAEHVSALAAAGAAVSI